MVTVTLRPSADGTYSQLIEVPNAGFTFGDQFESNNFSLWTGTGVDGAGSTVSTVNTPIHHGTYSCRVVTVAGAEKYGYATKTFAAKTTIYYRYHVRFAANIDSATRYTCGIIIATDWSWSCRVLLYRESANVWKWSLAVGGWPGTVYTSAEQTFALDTQYCIEVKVVISATVGEARLYLDGSEIITQTGLNTGTVGIGEARAEAYSNPNSQTASQTVYFDCFSVSSAYVGVEDRAHLAHDSSDSTALQVTGSTTQKEMENLEDSADLGTINSVTAYARAEYVTGGGDEHARILWRLGATEIESAETVHLTNAFADYSDARATDPDGGAWSWADVNSLIVGARASTLGAAEVLWFSEFWIVVDYTAAGNNVPLKTGLYMKIRNHQAD